MRAVSASDPDPDRLQTSKSGACEPPEGNAPLAGSLAIASEEFSRVSTARPGSDGLFLELPASASATSDRQLPRYVGAKRGEGVWQRIISEMPRHRVFVEAFAGTGWISQQKRPAWKTILIDRSWSAPAVASPLARKACSRVIVGDARELLPTLGLTMADLVYADPPYLGSSRSCQRAYYEHELTTDQEHAALLEILAALPTRVMLSGYRSDLYDAALANWRRVEIPTVDRRGRRRVECLWMNFPETDDLHDVRFAGRNYRERLRIKRKAARWAAMLDRMSPMERAAVRAALGVSRSQGKANPAIAGGVSEERTGSGIVGRSGRTAAEPYPPDDEGTLTNR